MMKSLTPAPNTFGALLLPTEMAQDVFDLLLTYGAFRTLGVRSMSGQFTKFAEVTGQPSAVFITPDATSTAIPTDASFAGTSVTPEANIVGSLVESSLFLLEDAAVDFAALLLEKFSQAIAARLDYACFQGTGADDQTNGAQTGIFVNVSIPSVNAASGETAVSQLQRADFLNTVAAVAPAALQRPCRWWIYIPAFFPRSLNSKMAMEILISCAAPITPMATVGIFADFPSLGPRRRLKSPLPGRQSCRLWLWRQLPRRPPPGTRHCRQPLSRLQRRHQTNPRLRPQRLLLQTREPSGLATLAHSQRIEHEEVERTESSLFPSPFGVTRYYSLRMRSFQKALEPT